MPSEKAPAPEKPVVMAQVGRQLTQWPSSALGQWRFSTGLPFSTSRIFFFAAVAQQLHGGKDAGRAGANDDRSYFSIVL